MMQCFGMCAMAVLAATLIGCAGEQSATQPGSAAPAAPKAAVREALDALLAGDAQTFAQATVVPPQLDPLVAAMLANIQAQNELEAAFVDRFGREAWQATSQGQSDVGYEQILAGLDAREVTFDGDTARLIHPTNPDNVLVARHVAGRWRLDLGPMMDATDQMTADDARQAGQGFLQTAGVFERLAQGVRDGRITPQNFEQELNQALMQSPALPR